MFKLYRPPKIQCGYPFVAIHLASVAICDVVGPTDRVVVQGADTEVLSNDYGDKAKDSN